MSNCRVSVKWTAVYSGYGKLHRDFMGSCLGMTCDCIYDISPVSTATYQKASTLGKKRNKYIYVH